MLLLLGAVLLFWGLLWGVLSISALLVDCSRQYESESRYYRRLLNFATAATFRFLRVHAVQEGREKLPQSGSFLLVCNHRSKFDPLMTWLILAHRKVIYISKPENFRIPAFGKIIHRLRFIQIDRTSIGTSAEALRQGTALLKEPDTIVAVYPEGTRSLNNELLPFHAVVFTMAKHAKVPVVVMSIRGTETIRQNAPWRTSRVHLDFIETIPAEWIAANKTRELCARAESDIRASLETPPTPPAAPAFPGA